jgi:(+)-trans-carveol dehydrogenase
VSGRLSGHTALITGAARGLGQAVAVRFAEEGADIIGLDFVGSVDTIPYQVGRADGLRNTAEQVEQLGRRIATGYADIRDLPTLESVVASAVESLDAPTIVVANAGIFSLSPIGEMTEKSWDDVIDTNLKGAFNTVKAALPYLSDGGSIVLTSSTVGLKGMDQAVHYTAAKHGVVGLMKALTIELAPRRIRVNTVNPATVDTEMINNKAVFGLFGAGDGEDPKKAFLAASEDTYLLPTPWLEPVDIANAVLFLASDEARFVTGVSLPVDAGQMSKA